MLTESGSTWSQSAVLTDAGGDLADTTANGTVAISSDAMSVVAGAPIHPLADNPAQGAAYLFTKSGSSWSQTAQLTNAADGAKNDNLGTSVGFSGQTVLAGASGHTVGGKHGQGTVYLFGSSATGPPESLSAGGPATAPPGYPLSESSMYARLLGVSAPTGTITFKVFGPQSSPPTSCTSGGTTVGTASATGDDGTYYPNSNYTPIPSGDYWWYATYSGDSKNKPAASACGVGMGETVVPERLEMYASAPANDHIGTAIPASAISAELIGGTSPTGKMTFTVFGPQSSAPTSCTSGGKTVGTATVAGDGAYHPSASSLRKPRATTGGMRATAATPTTTRRPPSAASTWPRTVVPSATAANPSLKVTAPSNVTVGTEIAASSLSAILGGGSSPTGSIQFDLYGPQSSPPSSCPPGYGPPPVAVSGNGTYHPGYPFTPETAGHYWWYASYSGDVKNNPAASRCGASMAETVVTASPTMPTVTAVKPAVGPVGGGTKVAVTGTNFVSGSTTVDFGHVPGTSVTVSSSTGLTVISPASSAGSVDLTVTTPAGG